jgi:hypothetical protein
LAREAAARRAADELADAAAERARAAEMSARLSAMSGDEMRRALQQLQSQARANTCTEGPLRSYLMPVVLHSASLQRYLARFQIVCTPLTEAAFIIRAH